jgi:hypothetical protein
MMMKSFDYSFKYYLLKLDIYKFYMDNLLAHLAYFNITLAIIISVLAF